MRDVGAMSTDRIHASYDITGVVQGVGFRPAVYRLAREAGLAGSVQNRSGTVRLTLEGPGPRVRDFIRALPSRIPPNARIDELRLVATGEAPAPGAIATFEIVPSHESGDRDVVIPADLAGCRECAEEVFDAGARRYGYAFTTCTNCGPRYTVVNGMPYDRERTTMAAFTMCERCRAEYEDPDDRRLHAETIACPDCGPRLWVHAFDGVERSGPPLRAARRALGEGQIVGVRGIGGFLLAADALNRSAIRTIRERKCRPHRPLAVMAPDVATLRRWCIVPSAAEDLLLSPQAPIVVLDVLRGARADSDLPTDLASPDTATLGAMLPTSPLHELLFRPVEGDPVPPFELLVMTSGNRRAEPICITNEEALERLDGIADLLLCHDREINLRNDDSLCALQCGAPQLWRRGRGYAPEPIRLSFPLQRCVLAMGAELKNTVAVGYADRVVLSPHVGDLETPEAVDGMQLAARRLPEFLERTPEAVAVDLHPDMHSTRTGERTAHERDIPLHRVQHHHAHAAACLAEHGQECGLALCFDGTGLGPDGSIWGAELLDVRPGGYTRLATFAGVPLPGGDAAVREPARQLIARWGAAGIHIPDEALETLGITAEEAAIWDQQCSRGLNSPISHAAGRLFDAASSALGVAPARITYEGQAAIRLEAAAANAVGDAAVELPFGSAERNGLFEVDWTPTFALLADRTVVDGNEDGLALALHDAVARAAVAMVQFGFGHSQSRTVALSGGVFMNRVLTSKLVPMLETAGAMPLIHRQTPPNDGCIAFGQAVIAGTTSHE